MHVHTPIYMCTYTHARTSTILTKHTYNPKTPHKHPTNTLLHQCICAGIPTHGLPRHTHNTHTTHKPTATNTLQKHCMQVHRHKYTTNTLHTTFLLKHPPNTHPTNKKQPCLGSKNTNTPRQTPHKHTAHNLPAQTPAKHTCVLHHKHHPQTHTLSWAANAPTKNTPQTPNKCTHLLEHPWLLKNQCQLIARMAP